MANIPLYVLAGYMAEGIGTQAVQPSPFNPAIPVFSDWSGINLEGSTNYGARATGYGSGDPVYGAETQPSTWNHDSFIGSPVAITSSTAGNPTTFELIGPHDGEIGTTREITIQGVTGVDAAKFNGLHVATFTSATEFTVPVVSFALTFDASSAQARVAGWSQLRASLVQGIVNTNTDPSFYGANLPQTSVAVETPGNRWGPIVSLAAPLHDRNGPNGDRTRFLQVGGPGLLLGRTPFRVTAVTNGATTEITFDRSVGEMWMREDNIRTQPITLYGFTGALDVLNGRQLAYNENGRTSTTLKVEVDTSAAPAYVSGAVAYTSQRWATGIDGEMLDEFRDRVREVVAASPGDTLIPSGLSFGIAANDVRTASNDNASQQGRFTGLQISDISDTGFPVRVTLAQPINLTQTAPSARYGLLARMGGAGEALTQLVDVRVISTTVVELLTENTTVFEDVSGVTLEIGEPIRFFAEEFPKTVNALQDILMEETGATEFPPTALYHNFSTTVDRIPETTTGQPRASDPQVYGEADRGITFALSASRKIVRAVVPPEDVGLRFSTNSIPTPNTNAALGRAILSAWDEAERDAAVASTGALPVYVLIGDSTCEGTVNYTAPILDGNSIYTGAPTSVRSGEKIWNEATGTVEDYLPTRLGLGDITTPGNGNTHPVLNLNGISPAPGLGVTVGPELSLFYEQRRKHPGSDVLFLKLGVSGSSLSARSAAYGIDTVVVSNDANGDPRVATITLQPGLAHRRADPDKPFTVTLSAIPGFSQGLVAGSYQATGTGALVIEVRTLEDITGAHTGGGTATIPNYTWNRSDNDAWFYLDQMWRNLIAWSDEQGRQLDVRGLFVMLGVNDAIGGDVANFQADATQLTADLRSLFQTRSVPTPPLPVTWVKPRTSSSPLFTPANLTSVQSALVSIASTDSAFGLFDPDTQDDADIEVNRFPLVADGVHYTFEGTVNIGKEMADTFDTIDNTGNANSSPEVSVGGGGALVEGTG